MSILFSGYEMQKLDGTPWTADYQICRTWGSFIQTNVMKTHARNQDASWQGELHDVYLGLYGWNLVIGLWHPDSGSGTNCIDGDVDGYLNPFTALNPTMLDAKAGPATAATGPFTLINHIGLSLGGSFVLDDPPTYSQPYEFPERRNG